MRKLALLLTALLWTQPALADDIDFGSGEVIGTFSAAILAGSNGDDFHAHAPTVENNQYLVFNLNNCTLDVVGAGDYVFDGTGVTQDWIKITGTGNDFDFDERFTATGYGRYVLWLAGAGNTVTDALLFANGYVGEGTLTNFYMTAASALIRPVVSSTLDNNGIQYGMYAIGSGGGSAAGAIFQGMVSTTAGANVYGVRFYGDTGSFLVSDLLMTGCSSGNRLYGVYWSSGIAATTPQVRRAQVSSNTGGGTHYSLYSVSSGMDAEDVVAFGNVGGPYYGVNITSTASHSGNTHRLANCVFSGVTMTVGVFVNQSVGNSPVVRNVIARDATAAGFIIGADQPDADYNLAFNNGTDYSGWVKGANSLEGVDPLHVNAAAGDFTLLRASPCIDAGADVAGRSVDFAGNPMSGNHPDIGPQEYQQANPRSVRTPVTEKPFIPSRDGRAIR